MAQQNHTNLLQQPNPAQLPNPNNPLNNLATQIGLLIQQMQATPAAQINVLHQELNLVSYPDFARSDQDLMPWLDEVEKAFAANLINDNRKIAVVVPHLKGSAATWWATIQRLPNPVNAWNNSANPT
ncbi:1826_t:CDS:1 [Ambispora leptoticha]|uniref:1826_t:CDS:1 n=1 Tax=Ambispora leptoticha TaxID=144679 RepID=A0A9N9H1X7_9GLOM|nr:1826_t:CDS:1 [Ambispora leptoticha]